MIKQQQIYCQLQVIKLWLLNRLNKEKKGSYLELI
jgi:hypothetical protein